jgi:SEC-C motif-containing protein
MSLCPCGSGLDHAACCAPLINGSAKAATAEALMRARYSAYTLHDIDFVMDSTLPAGRHDSDPAAMRAWAEQAEWTGLEVVSTRDGGDGDSQGEVEFIARYNLNGVAQHHHEKSLFVKQDGQWFFKDGKVLHSGPSEKPAPVVNASKTGRNDPCPCGTGKKFKKCCGA